MLIPYNVDRPARHIPYVTYSLMAINIFLFFVTVFIANVQLPADRIAGKSYIDEVLKEPTKLKDQDTVGAMVAVSYTHLTLPTKRIV